MFEELLSLRSGERGRSSPSGSGHGVGKSDSTSLQLTALGCALAMELGGAQLAVRWLFLSSFAAFLVVQPNHLPPC